MDDQNVQPDVDSLMFAMEIHTLQTYLGTNLIKRTLMAHSLAGKHTLSIKHVKHLFTATVQDHMVLVRRNMVLLIFRRAD